MKKMEKIKILFCLLAISLASQAQRSNHLEIPAVLDGFSYNADGKLAFTKDGQNFVDIEKKDVYTLSQMIGNPTGTETGIMVDLGAPNFDGTVAFGPYDEKAEYPTVAFLAKDVKMVNGKALLELKKYFNSKVNDFFNMGESGKGIIGYRIMNRDGKIIYEGRAAFKGKGPYEVLPTIIEGPMINILTSEGCVISFETQLPVKASITVGSQTFSDQTETTHHEITLNGLQAGTNYEYSVNYGERTDTHSFNTAPKEGSRKPFSFAFAAANRATTGGGENDFGTTNYEATRAIMAAAMTNNAVFMAAIGDITNGKNQSVDGHLMEYANFKRALEPFWFKIPVYVGFGDHEPSVVSLKDMTAKKQKNLSIETFPYATRSGEAAFARAFVNPQNGPESEDGASYDPNPNVQDFPTYKENVYYYTYDNVAVIVLNTEYWESKNPVQTSGCPEGYIMDQQVKWLKETVDKLEKNSNIDHIFVNHHGASFPNGDHLTDAMWWDGDNTKGRAVVTGVPLKKGSIERRDEILDICVNQSKKFLAFITGDEHNFSLLEVTQDTPRYLDTYSGPKLVLSRPFYTINNGGGGSASYAMLPSRWSGNFKYFTEPPVLALISVNGKSVTLKAFKADTFGKVCSDVKLR